MYAVGSWPDKCATYLLFMGSSLLPKDSCGPETADKHTKQARFFIWARRWLQMPWDMELNHKHAIIWWTHGCDTLAQQVCLQMVTVILPVWEARRSMSGGETSGHWDLWILQLTHGGQVVALLDIFTLDTSNLCLYVGLRMSKSVGWDVHDTLPNQIPSPPVKRAARWQENIRRASGCVGDVDGVVWLLWTLFCTPVFCVYA